MRAPLMARDRVLRASATRCTTWRGMPAFTCAASSTKRLSKPLWRAFQLR